MEYRKIINLFDNTPNQLNFYLNFGQKIGLK